MRTVSQTLLDAIENQQGETILRVKTWADLAAYNLAPNTPEETWETIKFKIAATEAEAVLVSPDNDYTVSDFTVFLIERGVSISGVEYVTQSDVFFVTEYNERPGYIDLKGSSYPDQKIVMDGDDTYENVITAFCTAIGKTAVFKDSGAAWLSYQFMPTGKKIILNKAERFENLIRQKYLIQCYARSPKVLVFYHAATEQSAWKDIIFADSKLVLTATSGSHEIATSSDGLSYTKTDAPSFTNAIAYSPTLDLFAAVGNGVCITSPDGITWTSQTIGAGNWLSITWDTSLAKFIAVRIGATATSANGTSWTVTNQINSSSAWTARSAAEANEWYGIAWSPSLSLFVAVSGTGTNRVQTSPDGITWTARAAPSYTWRAVCWSPELALFVAVGYNGGSGVVMTSSNGTTWTEQTPPDSSGQWNSVCWSPELTLFIASAGSGSGNRIMKSSDGINWTSVAAGNSNVAVAWSPALSLFVTVGSTIYTSPDGDTWTSRTNPGSLNWNSVCWSPELALFVAVGYNGGVMTSSNGTTWTQRTAAEANAWNSVTWSPELAIFVAVASSGTNRVMISIDGITWLAQPAANSGWWAVCWSPELSTFACIASSGTNRVMTGTQTSIQKNLKSISTNNGTLSIVGDSAFTSSDGATLTSQTIPAGTYHKIIYSNSLFVSVGESKCATSPDGITWTERTIPAGTYTGLAYSSTLDLFVAVGESKCATSPDGITWTERTAPADQTWVSVTWSDSLAQFFAVSSDGDNRIAASDDGINWQILTSSADFSLDYLDGPRSSIQHGTNTVHFLWRDEANTIHTEGDTNYPAWNLGYLESTDSAPQTNTDPFYKFYIQKAPLRLDITDGDRCHFSPSWTLDPTKAIDAMVTVTEIFDTSKSPAWYQDIKTIAIFESVEGGALPSTIERVAAYTPLVSSGFDGNLSPSVNNLQALAEAVDDLNIAGGSIPTTTAANDFQVGDGAGAWIKKTLAQTIAILRTSLDTVYATLTHTHAAGDITTGVAFSASNTNDIFRVNNAGSSIFSATINGTPSGASVVYNEGFTGNEEFLVPFSTSQLAKLRLYNTTRGNYALILNCNISTNTITLTANAPANWANGDTITITSQTVVSGQNHVDLEITSGELLNASLGFIWWAQSDALSLAGITLRIHPFEAFAVSKNQNFSLTTGNSTFVKLVSNVLSIAVTQTAPASGNLLAIRQVAGVK